MLNMAKVIENDMDAWRNISVPNTLLGLYKLRKDFSDHETLLCYEGWNSLYG